MSEHKWMVGLTQDNKSKTLGISVRRAFSRADERFEWGETASGQEIAAQLRNAALYLEASSDE